MTGKTRRVRIDQLLVERGLAESRSRAQALLMAGLVFAGERRIDKPGDQLPADTAVEVRGRDHPWVSRGGLKLDHGLDRFGIAAEDKICLDLGASTGGFTDVLLSRGARRVYAVDVGHGQLAWRLREDARVIVLEGVNARNLGPDQVPERVDLVTCDVSFIGLEKVLPAAIALAASRASLVALIKPQFQLSREAVGKGGVVRDPASHATACEAVSTWLAAQPGWRVLGITESPITGPKGNREFLIAANRGSDEDDSAAV